MRANLAAAASSPPLSFLDHIYHFFCPWFGGCEEPTAESMGTNALATTSAEPRQKPAQPAYVPATSAPSEPVGQQLTNPRPSAVQPIDQTVVNQLASTKPVARVIERVVETQRVVTEGGVSETTLADRLQQLENKLRSLIFSQSSEQSAQTSAVYNVVAQSQRIDNLSNTTITNPTITGGSITASSIIGTISSAISSALATIDDLTSNTVTATNVSFTNATTTTFYAGALSAGTASITNASTTNLATANLRVSSLNCTGYANGGTLTTDGSGNVVCATDDGGAGSSVAGSDTQVQFNSGGSFAAAASFTFASPTGKLSVPYASTTALTALGTGYFGTASTTNLTISGLPAALLSTDITGAAQSTTVSAPLSFSGSTLSIAQASSTANGYLSALDWNAFSQKFATTSSDYWIAQYDKGFFFSTTSAAYWDTTQWRWATTSSDYWISQYGKGFFFSTTSANAWDTVQFRWATTSNNYWESTQTRWATTSTAYWDSTQFRWATTSSNYWLTQNQETAFSTTSASAFLASKTTDNLSEGSTNKYYSTNLFAGSLAGTTTDALREGSTNLYFTNARADARINATSSIGTLTSAPSLGTLATSLTGVLKATAGVLSTALVDLTSNVTGTLGVGNGGTGWTNIQSNTVLLGGGAGALATTTRGALSETGSSILTITGGTNALLGSGATIQVAQANGSTNGFLASTDWTTFNGKQSALGFTPPPNTRSIATTYPLQGGGDLSADRTFSLAFGTTTANTWSSLQQFNGNASTTALTLTGNAYFPGSGIWNASGNVGIGTTAPGNKLTVNGKVGISRISPATADLAWLDYAAQANGFSIGNDSGVDPITFFTNGSERMKF